MNTVLDHQVSPEVTKVHQARLLYNDPRVERFVAESVGSNDCKALASLGWEVDGLIEAGVVFDNYTGVNVFMHFSRRPGHMIDRRFLRLVFSYAFEALKVMRVTGPVSSENVLARKFARKLGFKFETKLEGAMPGPEEGPAADLEFWVMRRGDCKHLIDWTAIERASHG